MNTTDRGILVGMVIGDGYLQLFRAKKKNRQNQPYECDMSYLVLHHSAKQTEYIQHKCGLLHSIFGGIRPKVHPQTTFLKATGKSYNGCRASKGHKYFRQLHRLFYDGQGIKRYTRQMLDMLTPHGIAIWFMDDGSAKLCCSKEGKPTSCSIVLHTYCPKEEAEIVIQYFKDTYDIEFRLAYHKTMNKFCVRANTANSKKFRKIVEQYIIPSMEYKINPIPS